MNMYRKSAANNHLQRTSLAKFRERFRDQDLEMLLEGNPNVLAEEELLLIISRPMPGL